MKQLYQVYMIDDFERFWAPGSEWHVTYTSMLGDGITFDDTMRVRERSLGAWYSRLCASE